VTPGQADAVAINIGAHSADGKSFFQQNSKELLAHMSSAGISVSDLKVETPSQSSRQEFDLNQQSGKHASSGEKQFNSEQNQRRQESERRQELWSLFRDKEAA
jgi:tRNA U34 5-carboxymethylaminomethyl modifying enzyme MnmG/GidA